MNTSKIEITALFPFPPRQFQLISVMSGFTRLSMKIKYVCRGFISLYVNFHNNRTILSTNLHVRICRCGGGERKKISKDSKYNLAKTTPISSRIEKFRWLQFDQILCEPDTPLPRLSLYIAVVSSKQFPGKKGLLQNNVLNILKHFLSRRQLKLETEVDIQLLTNYVSGSKFLTGVMTLSRLTKTLRGHAALSFVNKNWLIINWSFF